MMEPRFVRRSFTSCNDTQRFAGSDGVRIAGADRFVGEAMHSVRHAMSYRLP